MDRKSRAEKWLENCNKAIEFWNQEIKRKRELGIDDVEAKRERNKAYKHRKEIKKYIESIED